VPLVLSGPIDCVPLTPLLPDHAPDAEQAVASLADQLSVELAPWVTLLGLALSTMDGAAAATDTIADCVALPPGPWQVSVKVEVAPSGPVDCVPLADWLPDHPPEAEQLVTLRPLQVSTDDPPGLTVLGLA
jgi:hypothetical protein